MTRILIIEDEPKIAAFMAKGLSAAGYTCDTQPSGVAALAQLRTGSYDLAILDVGLPDLDGFEVLARLRRHGDRTPIVMVTARTSVPDIVAGLEGGADDYLPKPFHFHELLARVRLRLRAADPPETPLVLRHRDITLDLHTHKAARQGREVDLSAREFELLETFLRHPGEVLTRETLLRQVWRCDFDPGSNIVDVYIRYLRTKLGAAAIETVRGAGYRLS